MKNKKKKLVFNGILFDIYQWEQKLFDGTTKIFEKAVRIPSVQIIAQTEDKKLIILKEKQPNIEEEFFSLVGGMVEKGMKPIETAKKELKEEVGAVCEKMELWIEGGFSGKLEWKTYYYIAKNCKIVSKQNLDGGERIKPMFLEFEKFIKYSQKKNFRNKEFSNLIFRIIHNKKELNNFKKKICF